MSFEQMVLLYLIALVVSFPDFLIDMVWLGVVPRGFIVSTSAY